VEPGCANDHVLDEDTEVAIGTGIPLLVPLSDLADRVVIVGKPFVDPRQPRAQSLR